MTTTIALWDYPAFLEADILVVVAPLEYDEVDVGDSTPMRCLKRGMWLSTYDKIPFALLDNYEGHGNPVLSVELAVYPGQMEANFSTTFLEQLSKSINKSASYRGKVLSLEAASRYSGEAGVIKVHKLHSVQREQVILPQSTLELLERNVLQFVEQRNQRNKLKQLGMPIKKGILSGKPRRSAS